VRHRQYGDRNDEQEPISHGRIHRCLDPGAFDQRGNAGT